MSEQAPATYRDVVEGMHERFATVDGIALILDYEPKTAQTTPLVYSLLDSFQRDQTGQVTAMRYRILHRLVIQWQDNEQAEQQLLDLINAIPAAVDADARLNGRLERGLAQIVEGRSGFWSLAGATYRVVDFYSDVLTKGAVRSGI